MVRARSWHRASERFEIVVRYQGGHNAGHSVQVGDKSFVCCNCVCIRYFHNGKDVASWATAWDPIESFV